MRGALILLTLVTIYVGSAHAKPIDIICDRTDRRIDSSLSIRIEPGPPPEVSFGGYRFDLEHFYLSETRIELWVLLSLGGKERYFIDRVTGTARVMSFPEGSSPSESVYSCKAAKPRF